VPYLRRLVFCFPQRRPEFEPGSGNVRFVVEKNGAGRRFSPSTSVTPAKHSTDCFTLIIIYHHPGLVQYANSGLSRSGLVSTPPQRKKERPSGLSSSPLLCSCLGSRFRLGNSKLHVWVHSGAEVVFVANRKDPQRRLALASAKTLLVSRTDVTSSVLEL
jgi:hypothetical protein